MDMPLELSRSVQRILRTMISGLMLVQCFTVYIYLASYIVLLYPVFLEERPTLVLPWLLLAAIRNLLCELTSLALGLGTCVLLGPARTPCVKFVITKLSSIMPALYMWMLLFSYYHFLKVAATFKTFPAVLPSNDLDYGLELAVRRRRTKTLFDEQQVRKKLMDRLYCDHTEPTDSKLLEKIDETYRNSSNSSTEDLRSDALPYTIPVVSKRTMSDVGTYEDWFGNEVTVPRDTDRILEQIVLMLLRIGVFLNKNNIDAAKFLNSRSHVNLPHRSNVECITSEVTETPPLVASSKGKMASYLRDYPQIFMKKQSGLLGPLSSPVLHENNPIFERDESVHSIETKEISFDSALSINEDKENFDIKNKTHSKSIIHSQEEVSKYNLDKETEIISIMSKESASSKANSSESIESIINRMKTRAASADLSSNDSENSKNL